MQSSATGRVDVDVVVDVVVVVAVGGAVGGAVDSVSVSITVRALGYVTTTILYYLVCSLLSYCTRIPI